MRMSSLGPHADFIITAYAAAVFILIALIAWVWADYQSQRRVLNDLEQRGIKRRSRLPKRK
jgi:heme exporter protein D